MQADKTKRIVVIGAGAAGIHTGIALRERGLTNFVILEKGKSLGGTWRDNHYPGIACDVPAHYYSYRFEPNVTNKRKFASGPELWDYFSGVASKYGVADHIRYGVEVGDARWDGQRWQLTTTAGEHMEADIVISAVGRLHRPRVPEFQGIENFKGLVSHSSQWDPSVDLKGKRLGVIGTGSSAVQITSAAAKVVDHYSLFQRTAQWVLPLPNLKIPLWKRVALRLSKSYARRNYVKLENEMTTLTGDVVARVDTPRFQTRKKAVEGYLATVRDPELREKLTPNHLPGCKRMVMNGEFYEAMQRPNVDLVTSSIERFEENGIRTADGVLHELDIVILATGFQADSYLRPMTVTGAEGKTLDDIWADVFMNYKSVTLPYMPNLFTINGPFSPGGSLSILVIIENHVQYVMKLIDRVVAEDIAFSPSPERCAVLLEEIREKAKQTIWYTGGCTSWYLDKNGVPLVNPLTMKDLREDLQEPIYEDYVIHKIDAKELVPA